MDMPVTINQVEQCAPSAPAAIVEAIIRTESGFNPIAINVNRGVKLARQPASRKEAEAWARWLLANGYNFDAGLMQINSTNWKKLRLIPENVFDPCENIRAGAEIFNHNYSRAAATFGHGPPSLISALSAYNTGDFTSGVQNGYASKVVENARIGVSDIKRTQEIPPLIPAEKNSRRSATNERKKDAGTERNSGGLDLFSVPTTIDNFTTEDTKPWDVEPKPELTPGSEAPGASNPRELQSPGWQKKLSMKTKRFLVTILLEASLMTA